MEMNESSRWTEEEMGTAKKGEAGSAALWAVYHRCDTHWMLLLLMQECSGPSPRSG